MNFLLSGWANFHVCSIPASKYGVSFFFKEFNYISNTLRGVNFGSAFISSANEKFVDIRKMKIDIKDLLKIYNWQPKISIEEGIKKLLKNE